MIRKELKKHTKKKSNKKQLLLVTISSFLITVIFTVFSESTLPKVSIIGGIIILLLIILVNILFDMIGVAFTSANITIFNSMSSRKVKGSKKAVDLIKNADAVASICNDVVGDICGIVSGVCGVVIANKIALVTDAPILYISLLVTGLIAAITIGGKAAGKSTAINQGNYIVFRVAKILSF